MAILTFALGLLLVVGGLGGLLASLNLVPTEIGLTYALCGTLALCAGVVTLAIGALIAQLKMLAASAAAQGGETAQVATAPIEEPVAPSEPEPQVAEDEAIEPAAAEAQPEPSDAEANASFDEEPINENRTGHLPSMATIERVLVEPETEPTLVGHYSSGGANYKIFSDGSIEAETEGGAFKFASMADFKAYLAGDRG
jgi:hypothetical protein